MEISVQTHNPTKQYGQHKAENNVNRSVYKEEIYGRIGRIGAGKTTIVRLLCGLAKPTKGDVSFFAMCDYAKKGHKIDFRARR